MEPSSQPRSTGLPALGMRPKAQENLLRHVLRHSTVTEHASSEGDDPCEMALDQGMTGRMISSPDSEHQRLIGCVVHSQRFNHSPVRSLLKRARTKNPSLPKVRRRSGNSLKGMEMSHSLK